MSKIKLNNKKMFDMKPDYKQLSLRDRFLIEEIAFVMYEIDPDLYINEKKDEGHSFDLSIDIGTPRLSIPLSLASKLTKEKQKCIKDAYLILATVEWGNKYKEYVVTKNKSKFIHPFALVQEIKVKELPLPNEFYQAVSERYKKETGKNIVLNEEKDLEINTREETNNRKIITLMSVLIATQANDCIRSSKVNASQIMKKICKLAEHYKIDLDGLRSVDRVISQGFEDYFGEIDFQELKKLSLEKKIKY